MENQAQKVVMVAEDSPSIRKFVCLALKLSGYRALPANDGMDALEKLPNEKIDLLITDLSMPNMDGYRLIQSIRNDVEYKSLPIIVLSSLTKKEDIDKAMEYGANSYLIKPFNTKRIQYEAAKYL